MIQYLKITIPCSLDLLDLLIAELGIMAYDSFQETEDSLEAYIDERHFNEKKLSDILKKYGIAEGFTVEKPENINWNEQWEKNFDPVFIEDDVQIRAVFHEPKPEYNYDVVIQPKMSFGTGHHETTHLIVAKQLTINHHNKSVLDVGTGTGILAIMAHKLGAKSITVTDTDDWCIENSRENFELNGITEFEILQGTIDKLTLPGDYDIIFANINKNVLLAEIPFYAKLLSKDGILILSGFYSEDIRDLSKTAAENNLVLIDSETRNNWAVMALNHSKI
jgi:ribosomal protein L11 methyltransferase